MNVDFSARTTESSNENFVENFIGATAPRKTLESLMSLFSRSNTKFRFSLDFFFMFTIFT